MRISLTVIQMNTGEHWPMAAASEVSVTIYKVPIILPQKGEVLGAKFKFIL